MSGGFSVEDALDQWVAEVSEPRAPDGKWHPSSLYGCQRKAVYEVRGTPETNPRDERSKRILRVGNLLHEFIQSAVDHQVGRSVLRVEHEVPVELPEYNIVGSADTVAQISDDFWELHEYKSINSRSFKYNDLPKPEHVGQVTPYMEALRRHGSPGRDIPPLGDRLTRARITYVSKDDLLVEDHSVLITDAKVDDMVLRVAGLNAHIESETLPPRLPVDAKGKRSWQCGYCPFQTKCWEVDGE